jgi:hypothetical protein
LRLRFSNRAPAKRRFATPLNPKTSRVLKGTSNTPPALHSSHRTLGQRRNWSANCTSLPHSLPAWRRVRLRALDHEATHQQQKLS